MPHKLKDCKSRNLVLACFINVPKIASFACFITCFENGSLFHEYLLFERQFVYDLDVVALVFVDPG